LARRALTAVFAATAVAIVVIIGLWVFPGFLTGVHSCPLHVVEGGRSFCAEAVPVVNGQCTVYGPGPCPEPTELVFQGVWFQMQLANISGGPYLYGFVNESNGVTHNFGLVGDPLGPPSLNWTSPDDTILVAWQAPFATTGAGGLLTANVTCGVYLPGMGS
jgi:hypothetical protein